MKKSAAFCPCDDYQCEYNPINHDKGCNLCVESSVRDREIPKCFFLVATDDISDIEDWSFEAFARLVLR